MTKRICLALVTIFVAAHLSLMVAAIVVGLMTPSLHGRSGNTRTK